MTCPTRRLDNVCEIIMGQAPRGESYNTESEGWPLIAGASDFGPARPAPKKFTREASRISRPGDVILAIRASIGPKVLADGAYCLGRGVAALRPLPGLHPRFLWHWLGQSSAALAGKGRGATFKQVNRDDLGELEIPLPPVEEQARLAGILDQGDTLMTRRREALTLVDDLARSIFVDMFGDPASNSRQWRSATVERVAEQVTDGEHRTPRRQAEGIKLLSARNVRDGCIDFENVDHIGPEEHGRISRRCDPRRGDVLISCSGTIGRVAPVETDEPFSLVRSVALVRPRTSVVTTDYLASYLRTPALRAHMLREARSSSQANLFQGPIRNLPVLCPPLDLQVAYGLRLRSLARLQAVHVTHLAELEALFASLRHRAFRGEL
ncbi:MULTISPECIES: restriction endonuclease subunit S [unclassified Pseudofrankia]|uniref:restriction endonuclease subunit S n=1 Tax=unclassified Pseudofrankia TaxID=2994372 RepID=UPI0008DA6857|nr:MULTISPECIES: restriction endonuclease subunit S [unclassified Pseudofrankia]MDT3443128.1 restriction endonuclease subunit S [Pseudofrankia sp. BMG5.37]OHV49972.1 hypothetical protein BCD48_11540 [Pseudofrankia sp. BMG5.36]